MLRNCVWDFIKVTSDHYIEFIGKRTAVRSFRVFQKKKINEVDCVFFPAKT